MFPGRRRKNRSAAAISASAAINQLAIKLLTGTLKRSGSYFAHVRMRLEDGTQLRIIAEETTEESANRNTSAATCPHGQRRGFSPPTETHLTSDRAKNKVSGFVVKYFL